MEKKLNIQTLIDFIYHEMKMPDSDCLGRRAGKQKQKETRNREIRKEMIAEVLDYAEIKEGDDLAKFQDDIDFDEKREVITNRANKQVNIFNCELRESASIFQYETEELIDNIGIDSSGLKKMGLIGLLQAGQEYFYERTAEKILDTCEKYFKDEEEENEEEETK